MKLDEFWFISQSESIIRLEKVTDPERQKALAALSLKPPLEWVAYAAQLEAYEKGLGPMPTPPPLPQATATPRAAQPHSAAFTFIRSTDEDESMYDPSYCTVETPATSASQLPYSTHSLYTHASMSVMSPTNGNRTAGHRVQSDELPRQGLCSAACADCLATLLDVFLHSSQHDLQYASVLRARFPALGRHGR